MNDAFDAVRGDHALDEILVAGIADEQRNALGQELGEAGGQVVDHDDAFAGFHQRLNRVTSDIAGAAGDKHGHEQTHLPAHDPPKCERFGEKIMRPFIGGARSDAKPVPTFADRALPGHAIRDAVKSQFRRQRTGHYA